MHQELHKIIFITALEIFCEYAILFRLSYYSTHGQNIYQCTVLRAL